jgi:hypothetical protein
VTPGIADEGGGPQDQPMADVRASDADRQRVVDLLRTHTAEGRLTLDEFEERVGEALAAKTQAELRLVLRELPLPQRPAPSRPAPRQRRRHQVPTVPMVVLLVVVGTVALGHFAWWLIPIGFWVFGGGCGSKRHHVRGHRADPVRA